MFKGLFDEQNEKEFAEAERLRLAAERRETLLARARQFDLTALDESCERAGLYEEILQELLNKAAGSQEEFLRLVGHISKRSELRANRETADRMKEIWKTSPTKTMTAQMLRITALADDAARYRKSSEIAVEYFASGRLRGISAADLLTLIESESWVLSSEARRAGAGFALRETLAAIRRKLKVMSGA